MNHPAAPAEITREALWETVASWLGTHGLAIVAIVVAALALRALARHLIRRLTTWMTDHAHESTPDDRRADLRRRQRVLTLTSLLRSTSSVVIWTVAALMVCDQLGLPLAPLLASAGIGGLAIGFGAQSLVKDVISGVMLMIEDQFGVGDWVDLGEASGEVEEVTLRVTRLRSADGVVWYIRNGEILRVGNTSQGTPVATIDVQVAARADSRTVVEVLTAAMEELAASPEGDRQLLGVPSVAGIQEVRNGAMTMRIFADCVPGEQYAAARLIRAEAKRALDAAGVPGPPVRDWGHDQPS
ncbi:mechanosensitive ion channel family protein [Kytococcus sedentarius]|uniref:mechanosensitive ion channel family protein n=1 Tax=Kytococcus sedentarius TaxID=1276 RepID=UPI00194E14C4|nr:mechanosensitive ion channel domain-containing protein [Kytococcus sedentarius]QRO87967.1 mechanosensitive ion channel family protein [Kytococcus sedentarius]